MSGGAAVPVVDAAPLFTPSMPSSSQGAADAAIAASLMEHGAVLLAGLPSAVQMGAAAAGGGRRRAEALCSVFDLPMAAKRRQQVTVQNPENSNCFWGYYSRYQGPQASWLYNEHYQVGPAVPRGGAGSWSEAHGRFVAGHPDPHFDSNPWPEEAEAPGFKDEMQRYHAAMEGVGEAVLRSVARALGRSALGVDEDGAVASWAGGVSTLRPMRYPQPPKGWEAAAAEYTVTEEGRLVTAGAHCDNGTGISMLWQSSAGLEVRSPTTGEWLAVPHEAEGCEGSLLSVHVGKGLEILTGEQWPLLSLGCAFSHRRRCAPGRRLRATEHRVLSCGITRDAVGFFYCPHPGATLPLEAGRAYDPDDERTFPWARFSSNSTAPYRPGKTARVDTSPQKALDDPANLRTPPKL